ncbi:MAG: hypothetical protein UV55_C0031G0024 [Candidatus Gottesmanbacteria bacterium GW2011_GWC1_43_10]|nr:MAG: hypothetical protein UV55_C0031G0024 [Candidatus Gottesmanbacteria bacterium GW2011_GWC1_43_10]
MKVFLNDFFTKTERIMLAKRLAIALMVMKGYETKIIVEVLRVSSATVYHTQEWLNHGGSGLKMGLNKLMRQEKLQKFWTKVDRFLEEFVFKPSLLSRIPKNT